MHHSATSTINNFDVQQKILHVILLLDCEISLTRRVAVVFEVKGKNKEDLMEPVVNLFIYIIVVIVIMIVIMIVIIIYISKTVQNICHLASKRTLFRS